MISWLITVSGVWWNSPPAFTREEMQQIDEWLRGE